MKYDVIVIGGGPSGLMASIAAAENGAKVLLIDKGEKLGKKLAISGGGRCNVTNRLPLEEIIKHIPGNGRFLFSAFSIFNNEDIIQFFEGLGVKLKEEDHGRMFPVSNSAQSVVQALIKRMETLKIDVRLNTPVKKVYYENASTSGITLHNGSFIKGNAVVIAVGGKSVPHTGSTGDGYAWARAAGHTITELFPTEVPLTSNEPFIKSKVLQGLSLRDVAVSVLNPKGKKIITHQMDMIFTHFGLSGPAILRCSQFVVKALKKFNADYLRVQIDLFPSKSKEQLVHELKGLFNNEPKKSVKNVLKGMIAERYLLFLLEQSSIDPNSQCTTISNTSIQQFAESLKEFSVKVNGTLPIEKAFITGGGVSTKEIHPKTMGSKLVGGLFFCGEILDIHGYTGGYNITAAMVTGRIAGSNAY